MPKFLVQERGRQIEHEIWLMEFHLENLKRLWEKSKVHRILFNDDVNGDFHKFCNIFFGETTDGRVEGKGVVYIMDDFVGMMFISNITSRECTLHFSFFDGHLRLDISKETLKFIFDEYGFDRISTGIVPFASHRVKDFVEKLGFKFEGKKRKALLYKGGVFDLHQYGLLKEEFFALHYGETKWDTTKEPSAVEQQKV